jgi:hypothetical protein
VPLSHDALRRLGCDASLVRILERDGRPLSVGRKTRTIPPALRRALQSRDGGCAFPGCSQRHHVDAHHIEHWADGGRTDAANLILLCRFHHRLLHEGGYGVRRTRHGLVFSMPDGTPLPKRPPRTRGDCEAVARDNKGQGVHDSPGALRTEGDWYPLDLGSSVDVLLESSRWDE